MLPMLLLLLMG
ncbi:Protein of unknown function [Bacillus cytotoxicus]|nr:Protein of unknown function [Bacillus cytotoxicus]